SPGPPEDGRDAEDVEGGVRQAGRRPLRSGGRPPEAPAGSEGDPGQARRGGPPPQGVVEGPAKHRERDQDPPGECEDGAGRYLLEAVRGDLETHGPCVTRGTRREPPGGPRRKPGPALEDRGRDRDPGEGPVRAAGGVHPSAEREDRESPAAGGGIHFAPGYSHPADARSGSE